jgi:hypothetical protein
MNFVYSVGAKPPPCLPSSFEMGFFVETRWVSGLAGDVMGRGLFLSLCVRERENGCKVRGFFPIWCGG